MLWNIRFTVVTQQLLKGVMQHGRTFASLISAAFILTIVSVRAVIRSPIAVARTASSFVARVVVLKTIIIAFLDVIRYALLPLL